MSDEQLVDHEHCLRQKVPADTLLLQFTQFAAQSDGIARSIRVAVTSALSSPFLRSEGDKCFASCPDFPNQFFTGTRSAVIVGFGGLLCYLVCVPSMQRIHVADVRYLRKQKKFHAILAACRRRRPDLDLSISDGSDTAERLRKTDLAVITGSTLCNGTLEGLLTVIRHGCKVVLQGQSASIHPKVLFESGVGLVITTVKPHTLASTVASDRSGLSIKQFLENGLPWIYLSPR